MDLNSLLASLSAPQNSGQQQAQTQPQETQKSQQSLQDLLNSLNGIQASSSSSQPTSALLNNQPQSAQQTSSTLTSLSTLPLKVEEQPGKIEEQPVKIKEQPISHLNTPSNTSTNAGNSPSLDNVIDSIKAFTSQTADDSQAMPPSQQPQSTQATLSQLSSLSQQNSIPPKLSSIPPPLSSTPPLLSSNSPQLSAAPPQLSAASHQNLIPPPNNMIPSPKNIIPPPLSSSQHHQLIPPPLSTTMQSQIPPPITSTPPQLSTLPPPLSSGQSQMSALPPTLTTNQTQLSAVPPALSSTPPQLSTLPPTLSPNPSQSPAVPPTLPSNPPQLSALLSSLSSTPPQLSTLPTSLPSNPPQLSTLPPTLSSNPPQLSAAPPTLSSNQPQLSTLPPSLSSNPPQLSSVQSPLSAPPAASSTITSQPLNQPAGLFTLNLSNQSQQGATANNEVKAAAASNAIQSLFSSIQKGSNDNESAFSATTVTPTTPMLSTPPKISSVSHNISDYVKLDPFKITFPEFDFINMSVAETVHLELGQSIQAALDRAVPNAIIEIPSGTYVEEIEINKPVTLKAVGGTVNLSGKGESDTLLSRSSYLSIDGFNITQQQSKSGCAVNITDGFARITNCTIKSPLLSPLIAISNSKVYVESCQISDCHNPDVSAEENSFIYLKRTKIFKSETYGVLSKGNSHVIIDNCEITDIGSNAVSSAESGSVYMKDSKIANIQNSGFETASSVKSYIENCSFSAISACGVCANAPGQEVVVHHCNFTKCEMAGIKSSSHAKIRTLHNTYKDIGSNVMIIANDEGSIHCENDYFEGSCLAGIACFTKGLIIGKELTFQNISGSSILSYEKGQIQIDMVTISKCTGPGIHIRDQSIIKMRKATTKDGRSVNLVISDESTGEIFDSKFNNSSTIGAEIGITPKIVFSNCEFCDNKACGISVHDNSKTIFESCKFKSNGQIGIDISGNGCSPTFNQCDISLNSEAGVNCFSNATPVFNKCTFSMNTKIAIGCKASSPTVNDSTLTRNGQTAISVCEKSVFILNRTTFDSNDNFAGQIFSNGAICKLFDCKVTNHSISFVVSDGAKLRCRNTTFGSSKNPQFEIRSGGIGSFNGCDIGTSACGNGIQVHDNGKIKMKKTRVHDQPKLGMLLGNLGIAKITDHSVFENNGQVGIVCLAGSKADITDSTFNSNGIMSIQAQGEELILQNCNITNHKQCGVLASKAVKFTYSGNNFSNNGSKDIVVQ